MRDATHECWTVSISGESRRESFFTIQKGSAIVLTVRSSQPGKRIHQNHHVKIEDDDLETRTKNAHSREEIEDDKMSRLTRKRSFGGILEPQMRVDKSRMIRGRSVGPAPSQSTGLTWCKSLGTYTFCGLFGSASMGRF